MMAIVFTPLSPSQLTYASAGVPFSPLYGDVYHAVQGAVEQARHVFLGGNDLPGRWRGCERFTVCETGFGMGLNFLTLWHDWREDPARSRRLHVVAVEAHPFSREDLAGLLAERVPEAWGALVGELLAQWPPLLPGLHRLDLDGGAVTLTLAFGFALDVVPQLTARVDAFFLDGFSPARNPDMWSAPLMKSLARLAAPGATASTWSCAGTVRGALREAGFVVEKRQGFGYKRTMTAARYAPGFQPRHAPRPAPEFAARHAVVVGAGIAGANVAYALALRGWRVTVLDAGAAREDQGAGEAQGASEAPGAGEHLAAALTPLVARDDSARARLTRAGALRAGQRWAPWTDGDIVSRCGTIQQARSDERVDELRQTLQALQFPADWVRPVTQSQASALAGLPVARGGIFFADGLRVRPRRLCEALLAHPGIELRRARVERLQAVAAPTPSGLSWQALGPAGELLADAEVAIVANAGDAPQLLIRSGWPQLACAGREAAEDGSAEDMAPPAEKAARPEPGGGAAPSGQRFFQQQSVGGQITFLPENDAAWPQAPACIVAGEGYVLPPVDGFCVTGSTYVYDHPLPAPTAEGHGVNLDRAARLLPALSATQLAPEALRGWAGRRAVAPGRLPVVAELPGAPGLWVTAAYASRGLTWSALAGDLVAATLEGEPLMLERDLLVAIAWR